MKLKLNVRQRLIGYETALWRDSEPFVLNDRGILIHRPRQVTVFNVHSYGPHMSVKYYCGQGTNNHKQITFLAEPPTDRYVCEACEMRATMSGLPTSSELAGRHVCIGKLKAVVACAHG